MNAEERGKGGPSADLPRLVEVARRKAEGLGLKTVPAIPMAMNVPTLSIRPSDVGVEQFIELASLADVPFVYLANVQFQASEVEDIDPSKIVDLHGGRPDRLARALADARARDGEVCRLEVAFVHAGMLHSWSHSASWYDELNRMLASINGGTEVAARA